MTNGRLCNRSFILTFLSSVETTAKVRCSDPLPPYAYTEFATAKLEIKQILGEILSLLSIFFICEITQTITTF